MVARPSGGATIRVGVGPNVPCVSDDVIPST